MSANFRIFSLAATGAQQNYFHKFVFTHINHSLLLMFLDLWDRLYINKYSSFHLIQLTKYLWAWNFHFVMRENTNNKNVNKQKPYWKLWLNGWKGLLTNKQTQHHTNITLIFYSQKNTFDVLYVNFRFLAQDTFLRAKFDGR
jgi:hypothetical protein